MEITCIKLTVTTDDSNVPHIRGRYSGYDNEQPHLPIFGGHIPIGDSKLFRFISL